MIDVAHVDFVSVPTRDAARARRFHGEVLGFRSARRTPTKFETPDLLLALWQPEAEGVAFSANTADIALRVADVEASRERLSAQGVDFLGETVPARDGISPVSRSSSLPGTVVNGRPLLRSERPGRLPAGSRSGRTAGAQVETAAL